ncbi:hypothetical protein CU102_26455 [Phyllobacterium brassicacearum]|uniref:Uncharacterized protein n=1 Tax=Phyllobacterium brassicacearum TaxID=314235 RepID=A0A2P7B5J4_9HYPH|nr:hypothetical protein [Phyllobacterium brassicacearum]PSH61726.1 hypothetical protein CU102_26455 [Phyllobacterium brassicacearum]TDQ15318.1 hypothetical protein DEV91_13431 [Phyllobacterium brassicacearum]
MSRFYINLLNAGRIDDEAVIGYDKPLRTFFLQGFYEEESDFDEPEIWLGTCLEEFPTLESIVEEARSRGYEINGLHPAVRPADVIAMLAEVGHKPEPTIWERIGPIF